MIKMTIDGREIQATEGQTVLEAAKENQIKIPHLCYHPALKPSGSCKLCGIEVTSPTGNLVVMLSCILKVKENLEVKTNTELVRAHRQKSFDRLIQMAPDAQRIRDLACEWGVSVAPPADGCIRCRLCIRVCGEIIKAKALKMVTDKNGSRVMPEPGRCMGCGTCANLCPTHMIRINDVNGVRTVSIRDEIIGQLPLERCEGCGKLFATENFLTHVKNSMGEHPASKDKRRICPTCMKLMSGRTVAEARKK
jgi:bidirectional [NiFe] hydrogenase diaphorase subunit